MNKKSSTGYLFAILVLLFLVTATGIFFFHLGQESAIQQYQTTTDIYNE